MCTLTTTYDKWYASNSFPSYLWSQPVFDNIYSEHTPRLPPSKLHFFTTLTTLPSIHYPVQPVIGGRMKLLSVAQLVAKFRHEMPRFTNVYVVVMDAASHVDQNVVLHLRLLCRYALDENRSCTL